MTTTQTKQAPQSRFPPGQAVVRLEVGPNIVFAAGSIPDHVIELNMQYSKPVFEEGAIHLALKYLWVLDLVEGSHYHDELCLFVHTYSGGAIPVGPQVFIHANDRNQVSKYQEHYLFHFNSAIPAEKLNAPEYDHGEQFSIKAFDMFTLWAIKCTPKSSEPVTAPVSEVVDTQIPGPAAAPVLESVVTPTETGLDEEQGQSPPS